MPTVKEMVMCYLQNHGFDGLFNEGGCACLLEDLMPCGEMRYDCETGYKGPCTCGEGCDFDVYAEKPESSSEAEVDDGQ